MSVVVAVQHPSHVHFFRHAVADLRQRGETVHVFAAETGTTTALLDAHGIRHEVLAGAPGRVARRLRWAVGRVAGPLPSLAATRAVYEARLLRRVHRIRPDAIAAIGGVAAHTAAAVGARSVVFYDAEDAALVRKLALPVADEVCTPATFRDDLGPKQVRYPGVPELAYLHPDRFAPDPAVPATQGLGPDDRYAVCRLADSGTSHDAGQGGLAHVRETIARIEATGTRVLLSSERPPPADLAARRATVTPDRLHDLLAFADLFVGEGATMAAESAVLGTPAVHVDPRPTGYTDELESRYGLLFGFSSPDRHERGLAKAVELLDGEFGATWRRRRTRLLAETVDVTDVVVERILAAAGRTYPADDPAGPTHGSDAPGGDR